MTETRQTWEMRQVPHSPPINLGHDETGINEYLRDSFDYQPPCMSFPYMWWPDSDGIGGSAVSDPATLYVGLPLTESFDDPIYFEILLADVVEDLIERLMSPVSGKVKTEKGQTICRQVAARLRELADRLDAACEPT